MQFIRVISVRRADMSVVVYKPAYEAEVKYFVVSLPSNISIAYENHRDL